MKISKYDKTEGGIVSGAKRLGKQQLQTLSTSPFIAFAVTATMGVSLLGPVPLLMTSVACTVETTRQCNASQSD